MHISHPIICLSGPPTIATASWHSSLRPYLHRLTAAILLHTYPTPYASSCSGPAPANSMHSATKLNLCVILSSCKQKCFLDSTAGPQFCRPICIELSLLQLAACS